MPKKPDAKPSKRDQLSIAAELIKRCIFLIRGHKVMIDADLADLYQVTTGNLNFAVKRNLDRFPDDFMFQLTRKEFASLRFQSAISNRGGRRYLPYAFTEHGVAMLSSVLNSQRAVQMNILIIRAFIKFREMLATHTELAHKVVEIERLQTALSEVLLSHFLLLFVDFLPEHSR
jgi:hypothetical protein